MSLLQRDIQFFKVKPEDKEVIINKAIMMGKQSAQYILTSMKWETTDSIYQYIEHKGIVISRKANDYTVKGIRYCAEIFPKKRSIILYDGSILEWSKCNAMSIRDAETYILLHELYHFIEHESGRYASDIYQTPIVQFQRLSFGKSGIMQLSEIAANAFTAEILTYLYNF